MTLAEAYAILQHGTLWSSSGRCKGYAVANPGEAAKIDAYVAALAAGLNPDPPELATDTGRGIVGMLAAAASLGTQPAPTPAPPPPAVSIEWGARIDGDPYGRATDAPWDTTDYDLFVAHCGGKKPTIIHFGQPQPWTKQTFDKTAHDNCYARGAVPLVSYGDQNDDLAAVARGDKDAAIAWLADTYKAYGKRVLHRLWWEMNQYSSAWFNWAVPTKVSTSIYLAASRRYINIFHQRGATNVEFVWCPNFVRTDTSRVQLLRDCYWGDDYADRTGFDGYNSYAPSAGFATLFKLTYDTIAALAPSKKMIIGEFASRDTTVLPAGAKGAWIRTILPEIKAHPLIDGVVWFNWNIVENGERKDWQIESSPDAQSAFADAIKDNYFRAAA